MLSLALPAAGQAAWLAGGATQRVLARAFAAQHAHRGQAIVSIRTSSVSASWAVVRSVTPQTAGQSRSGATPALHSTYYRLSGGRAIAAPPPKAVMTDLTRNFQVAVLYAGSGAESVTYQQVYGSNCAGQGGFVDTETDAVSPMSWRVRYIVDVDDLLSAVRGASGVTLVPNVTFDRTGSEVSATEALSRTVQDVGCNGKATTFDCTNTFSAGGSDPGGQLAITAGSGLQVGVPVAVRRRGGCNADNFTLGPSLWDSGAATALVGRLGLLGGAALPSDPYKPLKVSWPANSAQQTLGFTASPCAGDSAACQDAFHWTGTVSLESIHG
jgi:hypothetical protein